MDFLNSDDAKRLSPESKGTLIYLFKKNSTKLEAVFSKLFKSSSSDFRFFIKKVDQYGKRKFQQKLKGSFSKEILETLEKIQSFSWIRYNDYIEEFGTSGDFNQLKKQIIQMSCCSKSIFSMKMNEFSPERTTSFTNLQSNTSSPQKKFPLSRKSLAELPRGISSDSDPDQGTEIDEACNRPLLILPVMAELLRFGSD